MATGETFFLPKGFVGAFWGGVFFSAVCLFWVIGGLPRFEDNLGAVIIGGVGALFFVPMTVILGSRLIRKTPTATISGEGLEVPGLFIEWTDISCLRTRRVWGRPWIDVVLHDPHAVISRASLFRRPNKYINIWLFKSPVFISPALLGDAGIFLVMASSYVPIDRARW